MATLQDAYDDREIALDLVGVTGLVHPALVPERGGGGRPNEARFDLFVSLGAGARAAHMSRFVEVLQNGDVKLDAAGVQRLLERLRSALGAPSASAEIESTFFARKVAPVSGERSLLACDVRLEASLGEELDLVLTVVVPVFSVCPCSIETTGGPAHSQRGHVAVAVRVDGEIWIEEIVELVEKCASAPVYPLLKTEDEGAVLAQAHEAPVFVEDLVRNVAERLDTDVRIHWYRVEAENMESVHGHNAFACVERSR